MDTRASAKLELVDKFCYLGDMLSVDGDADAAVEARIWTGWKKFRQLVPLLTNKDVSLIIRGRLYSNYWEKFHLVELKRTNKISSKQPKSYLLLAQGTLYFFMILATVSETFST